jgi:hypothetical protein
MTLPEDLDPIYFADQSWSQRLLLWLKNSAPQEKRFVAANEENVTTSILTGNTALRMVVNIPAVALLRFLESGKYKNTYEVKAEMARRTNWGKMLEAQKRGGIEKRTHWVGFEE